MHVDGREFEVLPGPYTLAANVTGPLVAVDSLASLEAADIAGAVVLLHGEIAADQLFPKSFDFVEAPEHRRIYELLESGSPAAVVGATGRGGGMGGALYPYPLIEDGDFDIPNAYTTDVVGRDLAEHAGHEAALGIVAQRMTVGARQLTAAAGPRVLRVPSSSPTSTPRAARPEPSTTPPAWPPCWAWLGCSLTTTGRTAWS